MSEVKASQEGKEREIRREYLAPLEEWLKGSTPVVRGEVVDVDSILERGENQGRFTEEDLNLLLTPTKIQENGTKALKDVSGKRIIAPEIKSSLIAVPQASALNAFIRLSHVGNKGRVQPEWPVRFFANSGQVEQSSVELNPLFSRWFVLKPAITVGSPKILSLKFV